MVTVCGLQWHIEAVESTILNVVLVADWYNAKALQTLTFYDENTRSWWTPATGGSNVPSLNTLLRPFGIAFGDTITEGLVVSDGQNPRTGSHGHGDSTGTPSDLSEKFGRIISGTVISRFPKGGRLLFSHQTVRDPSSLSKSIESVRIAIMGFWSFLSDWNGGTDSSRGGRVSIFVDSSCLDSSQSLSSTPCWSALEALMRYSKDGEVSE